jgi:hypothetical protein
VADTVNSVQLKPATLEAFEAYIRTAEAAMEQTLHDGKVFLWSDVTAERAKEVRAGRIVSQLWSDKGPVKVPDGLIHDWIGAAFVPGATVERVLALVQNYDNHKTIYKPDVIDSNLISRDGNHYNIHLRLLKKKVITVVLDTEHDVQYAPVNGKRWICRSYSTRMCEVEGAGKPTEKLSPPDTGYGFLWRLYSYWRFEERDGGVHIECRAISLTRDVPKGLGWIIEPIIRNLPRESLINILEATRRALSSEMQQVSPLRT